MKKPIDPTRTAKVISPLTYDGRNYAAGETVTAPASILRHFGRCVEVLPESDPGSASAPLVGVGAPAESSSGAEASAGAPKPAPEADALPNH